MRFKGLFTFDLGVGFAWRLTKRRQKNSVLHDDRLSVPCNLHLVKSFTTEFQYQT